MNKPHGESERICVYDHWQCSRLPFLSQFNYSLWLSRGAGVWTHLVIVFWTLAINVSDVHGRYRMLKTNSFIMLLLSAAVWRSQDKVAQCMHMLIFSSVCSKYDPSLAGSTACWCYLRFHQQHVKSVTSLFYLQSLLSMRGLSSFICYNILC